MSAVPAPSEGLLERGHELTAKIRDVEAELSAWCDEQPPSRSETVDARMHADAALVALGQARNAIAIFTQIAAELG